MLKEWVGIFWRRFSKWLIICGVNVNGSCCLERELCCLKWLILRMLSNDVMINILKFCRIILFGKIILESWSKLFIKEGSELFWLEFSIILGFELFSL